MRVSSNSFSLLAAIAAKPMCVQARDRMADEKTMWGLHHLSSPWHAEAVKYGRHRGKEQACAGCTLHEKEWKEIRVNEAVRVTNLEIEPKMGISEKNECDG